MIDGRRHSLPLWGRLLFVALPAAALAASGVAASVSLTATLDGSVEQTGMILGVFYGVARRLAQYAVFIGAPAAVLALLILLMVGGYGRQPEGKPESEQLPAFLGRVVMGSALFAGLGIICQLTLAAKVGGIF